MKSNFLNSSSILRKFLVFNFIVFLFLGFFTFFYLSAIKPNLVKNRSNQHSKIIKNTSDHISRLNIQFTKESATAFLLSTRFLFQNLDRVQLYDLESNLIADTDTLDLAPDVLIKNLNVQESAIDNFEESFKENQNLKKIKTSSFNTESYVKKYSKSKDINEKLIISEAINKKVFGAILIGLTGIYTVLDFTFLIKTTNISIYSIGIAIAGSFLTSVAYVLVRKATKVNEHPLVVMFYFPLFTVPMCLPFLISNWVHPSPEVWGYLFLVGICTQSGQVFLTHGYKELPAAEAAPLSYVQVPFAMIMGAIFFDEIITINFIIGSTLVLISIFIVMANREEKK